MKITNIEPLLRPKDLARALNTTPQRISQVLSSGKLPIPVLRVGRAVYVRKADWEAWLSSAITPTSSGEEERV